MLGSFRNFAKSKFAGIFVFLMIIPFVFWGMGSIFSSGNTNNLAKINDTNISTQEFIDFVNNSNIPQHTIRENIDDNIIEELLSTLISKTLINLEINDLDIIISENTLLNQIKKNKNFLDENKKFQRTKYEKFLLENNQSAAIFEKRLKDRELQKNLFDYFGAGIIAPEFLVKKLFIEENSKLDLEFINLKKFYKKKEDIVSQELIDFLKENKDKLKVEYIDFKYAILNPKNLIGTDEFNQSFFDKIDDIEIDISNEINFETIVSKLNIESVTSTNFKLSSTSNEIEKKIFELRNNKFDIFENENDYILYKINKNEEREPDINDLQTRDEILEFVYQKNKFDYNAKLIENIQNNNFKDSDFEKLGQNSIENITLNSIRDNKKFDINAVKLLYSLPINSFTLINDEKENIYLAKVKNFKSEKIDKNDEKFKDYLNKENFNNKNSILKSYDLLLNKKYDVVLNQKTIDRVKNFFK